MPLKELNQQLSLISRIVIHPKYRSIGLGEKLIKDSLPLAGTPNVEMIAVMPKYNPFAEHAGLRKITLKEPPQAATKIAAELEKLDFDLPFLASQHYVTCKLEGLTASQLTELKGLFKHNGHPMFKEIFGAVRHKDRNINDYKAELEKQA
jgi:ABC-type ATPase with predicted acetyltransferase domain